jgi:hypothetical protein
MDVLVMMCGLYVSQTYSEPEQRKRVKILSASQMQHETEELETDTSGLLSQLASLQIKHNILIQYIEMSDSQDRKRFSTLFATGAIPITLAFR